MVEGYESANQRKESRKDGQKSILEIQKNKGGEEEEGDLFVSLLNDFMIS
jgi:hypothetical protein